MELNPEINLLCENPSFRVPHLLARKLSTRGTHNDKDINEPCERKKGNRKKVCKTYSSRDSHVVTHRSTNLPFNCLCMAERTGCPVFS
ncbi:hypothetical protein KCU92_g6196, partial [Aureobasidium melanogenum]